MANLSSETLTIYGDDPDKTRHAALVICGYATDVQDATELLRAAGIIPDPEAQPVNIFIPGMDHRRNRRKKED